MKEDVKVFLNPDTNTMPFAMESLGISYCDESYHMVRPEAYMDVFEFVISGKGTVETSTATFHPSAGDSYLLRKGEYHNYYSDPDEPWVKIWINVMGNLPPKVLDSYGFYQSILLPKLDISGYIKQIHEIARADTTDMNTMYDRCFVVFLRLVQYLRQRLDGPTQTNSIPENVVQLKNYIDLNLGVPLTMEICNEITHLSTSQTIRSFRQAYGVPPYEYLSQQRIESAKVLLRGSSLTLQDIASQLGFSDQFYFSKYFKKRVGQSPKDYRKYKD